MRVSQPVNLCVRARGHVTVFIQNFVLLAEILPFRFVLCDACHAVSIKRNFFVATLRPSCKTDTAANK